MTRGSISRGFPEAEFEKRVLAAQRLMSESALDAMLFTTEPEVRYFSGFLTQFWQSPTRPWFLMVPAAGKPVAVIPGIGGPLMRSTWLDDVRTWPSPRPEDEGISLLAATIRELIGASARIGVPMGPESLLRMPLADYVRLQAELPGCEFIDSSAVVRALRMTKSDAEIEKIAHICEIASIAFEELPGRVREGQPLGEVFRDFKLRLLSLGADDVPYLVGASARGGYDNVISPPGEAPLAFGDVLMMDTGAVFDGYFCDFDRNYAVGRADDDSRRAYDTLFRATDAGFSAARPGASCAEVFRAMQDVIIADGYEGGNVGRFGHGLGMQLTEWPSHTPGDTTRLAPGMVITLEPSLEIAPGRGMVHEENIVIRENGAEFLSRRAAPELPVV